MTLVARVPLGRLFADAVTFEQAIELIVERAHSGSGGYVVTPNVDHVCLAESDPSLIESYSGAFLALCDGMPLLWISRLLGLGIPEKVSGSDLLRPLLVRAAAEKLPVYLLGARPEVAERAQAVLEREIPSLLIVGRDSRMVDLDDPVGLSSILDGIRHAAPRLLLVAIGCPKQEHFVARHMTDYRPAVAVGVGASLDFVSGEVRRAPAWMSRVGLEFAYRLLQEPRRLFRRYLVRDSAIVRIFIRMAWRRLMRRD